MVETYRGAVYPWHCDHIGHMNVMWYVGKFDEATWNLLAAVGITPSYLREGNRGMAAVQQNIAYKRELHAGDTVIVRSGMIEARDKVLRYVHEMANSETGETTAVCELTVVHLDRATRRAAPLPDVTVARAREMIVEWPRS
ncbi:MAG: acyl-CoA thioesterase [Rhodospirillales bacterium]|nr:acyl-CoA thioesterase [Rhodospirillales bacterium]